MLPIVAEMRPTGNKNQNVIESARLQIAQLFCPLIKGCEAVILRKVFSVVPITVRTHVPQNAQSSLRCSNQIIYARRAGNLLFERDEQPGVHHVTPIALGHIDVISIREENHPARPRIAEASELREPARTNHCRTA